MADILTTATVMDQVEKVLMKEVKHNLKSPVGPFVSSRLGNSKRKPVGLDFQTEKTTSIFNQGESEKRITF